MGFKQDNISKAPMSVSVAGSQFINHNELNGLRDVSSVFPNIFIADYGARQNTPIYIRGIGSKTNAPSVGLYIDGMPYFERSVVDLDIAGINGIENSTRTTKVHYMGEILQADLSIFIPIRH